MIWLDLRLNYDLDLTRNQVNLNGYVGRVLHYKLFWILVVKHYKGPTGHDLFETCF